MRSINPIIAQTHGLAPVNIIQIQWATGGAYYSYSDKLIPDIGLLGKVIELSDLEGTIDLRNSSSSHSINVLLDDTDGSIKQIVNYNDIHKRPVRILQWFEQVPITEAFLLFEGVISSPIVWKEGDRSLGFTVVSNLEDNEAGFSPDDGEFDNVPQEMVGRPWPMVFGVVVNLPALQLDKVPHGTISEPIGIPDRTITLQINLKLCEIGNKVIIARCMSEQGAQLQGIGFSNGDKEIEEQGDDLQDQAAAIRNEVNVTYEREVMRLQRIIADQEKYNKRSFNVIGGVEFIQNTEISILINKAHFTGRFSGNTFLVSSRRGPDDIVDRAPSSGSNPIDTGGQITSTTEGSSLDHNQLDFLSEDLSGPLDPNALDSDSEEQKRKRQKRAQNILNRCKYPNLLLPICPDAPSKSPVKEGFWFADAGAAVTIADGYPIRYILSITPVTVEGVSAYRSVNGIKKLVAIPTNYYHTEIETFGSLSVTMLVLTTPLSSVENADWGNEIYVSMTGSIGPNPVTVIEYLILTYSSLSIDSTSFNQVRAVIPFGANFAYTEKKNVLQLIKDIAFQINCIVFILNNVVYIKYLAIEGSSIETIILDDIDHKTFELSFTGTEDLVTKFTALWKQDYAINEPIKYIAKLNAQKYGIHSREENYFIFNDQNGVARSVAFWLIRLANTWKKVKFNTFLTKLKIESLDTITFNLGNDWLSDGSIESLCEKVSLNTEDFTVGVECWVPIRSGEMTKYPGAYPDDVIEIYPLVTEEAGSFGPSAQASGDLSDRISTARINRVRTRKQRPSKAEDAPTQILTTVAQPGAVLGVQGTPQATLTPHAPSQRADTKPTYRYNFRDAVPVNSREFNIAGLSMPGFILTPNGANPLPDFPFAKDYRVKVFPHGPEKESSIIIATQLALDDEDTIPIETPVIVTRIVSTNSEGELEVMYVMQVATAVE